MVTQLFCASSTTTSPSARAVPTGAQKWLRLPTSENASVDRCSPAAMARRAGSVPWASTAAVAEKCIIVIIAVALLTYQTLMWLKRRFFKWETQT